MGSNSDDTAVDSSSKEAGCSDSTIEIKIKTMDAGTYMLRVNKHVNILCFVLYSSLYYCMCCLCVFTCVCLLMPENWPMKLNFNLAKKFSLDRLSAAYAEV